MNFFNKNKFLESSKYVNLKLQVISPSGSIITDNLKI